MFYDPITFTGFIHYCVRNIRHNDPTITTRPHKRLCVDNDNDQINSAMDADELAEEVNQIKYLRPVDQEIKARIVDVMAKSLELRQAWMMEKRPTVAEILDKYPHFKDIDGLVSPNRSTDIL